MSLFPNGRPAPGLQSEQVCHHLSQSSIAPCWEALPTALATGGRVLPDLLLKLPLHPGRASCKAKHVPSCWWAPDYMASLNNPHQQQHGHSPHLRSEPSTGAAHMPLLNGDMCIYSLRTGLTKRDSRAPEGVFLADTVA